MTVKYKRLSCDRVGCGNFVELREIGDTGMYEKAPDGWERS